MPQKFYAHSLPGRPPEEWDLKGGLQWKKWIFCPRN